MIYNWTNNPAVPQYSAFAYAVIWPTGPGAVPPVTSGVLPQRTLIGYPFPDAYTQIGSIT